jgi:hypothetical protein
MSNVLVDGRGCDGVDSVASPTGLPLTRSYGRLDLLLLQLLARGRAERGVDDRQGVLARDVAHVANTQHA